MCCSGVNRIDLTFCRPNGPDDEQLACHVAFVATETLPGEERLDKWVGAIEWSTAAEANKSGYRLLRLNRVLDTFEAVRNSLLEQLPESPYSTHDEREATTLRGLLSSGRHVYRCR